MPPVARCGESAAHGAHAADIQNRSGYYRSWCAGNLEVIVASPRCQWLARCTNAGTHQVALYFATLWACDSCHKEGQS
jgi:hypothetical protein